MHETQEQRSRRRQIELDLVKTKILRIFEGYPCISLDEILAKPGMFDHARRDVVAAIEWLQKAGLVRETSARQDYVLYERCRSERQREVKKLAELAALSMADKLAVLLARQPARAYNKADILTELREFDPEYVAVAGEELQPVVEDALAWLVGHGQVTCNAAGLYYTVYDSVVAEGEAIKQQDGEKEQSIKQHLVALFAHTPKASPEEIQQWVRARIEDAGMADIFIALTKLQEEGSVTQTSDGSYIINVVAAPATPESDKKAAEIMEGSVEESATRSTTEFTPSTRLVRHLFDGLETGVTAPVSKLVKRARREWPAITEGMVVAGLRMLGDMGKAHAPVPGDPDSWARVEDAAEDAEDAEDAQVEAVLAQVADELKRQGRKWCEMGLDKFCLYIHRYANRLTERATAVGEPKSKLDYIREIAALCVAAMLQHGTSLREDYSGMGPMIPRLSRERERHEASQDPS